MKLNPDLPTNESDALFIEDIGYDAAPRGSAEPVFGDVCGFVAIVVIAFV